MTPPLWGIRYCREERSRRWYSSCDGHFQRHEDLRVSASQMRCASWDMRNRHVVPSGSRLALVLDPMAIDLFSTWQDFHRPKQTSLGIPPRRRPADVGHHSAPPQPDRHLGRGGLFPLSTRSTHPITPPPRSGCAVRDRAATAATAAAAAEGASMCWIPPAPPCASTPPRPRRSVAGSVRPVRHRGATAARHAEGFLGCERCWF